MLDVSEFSMLRLSALALLMLGVAPSVLAEHRVALLISNTEYKDAKAVENTPDIEPVVRSLERSGFHCSIARNLRNEYAFRDAIEPFAARTPTRSTAVVYYYGRIADGPGFLGTEGRGRYTLDKALQALATRSGSARNLLFIDSLNETELDVAVPDGVQLKTGSTVDLLKTVESTVVGAASQSISPSDRFIPGRKAGDEWVNSMGLVFCWCPPGKYVAGSPESEPDRYPDEEQREVVIPNGFWLSKYELAFSQRIAKRSPGRGALARHKLDPMTLINHDDAKSMTRTFTASEQKAGRLPSDWQYTLPTEDQWEYAARAGTTSRFYFGDDLKRLPAHANFGDRSYYESGDIYSNAAHRTLNDGAVRLNRVGSYEPNPWGFHDMYGNVAEWCINLAIRGGSWVSVPEHCRSAYRDSFSSRNQQNFIGYRIVIQKTPPK